jgi:hypothetical protein
LTGRYVTASWPHTTWLADMSLHLGLIPLDWQICHYNLASYHLTGRYVPTPWPHTTWLADMSLHLGLIPLDWQICPNNVASYHFTDRYVPTPWPHTTWLADTSLQLGLIPLHWQICHNLASYHLTGRYVTTTWPVPSSLYVLPCCLRFTIANHFWELCDKVRAAANLSTCFECKHDIYQANYCSFSEYL